jgi:hypothetical protein
MAEFREIRLRADLCAAVETKFAAKFGSIEEFVAYLLREITSDAAVRMDEADQKMIEERLKALGYI